MHLRAKASGYGVLSRAIEMHEEYENEEKHCRSCLYYDCTADGLVMMVSWIDDNLVVGSDKTVKKMKEKEWTGSTVPLKADSWSLWGISLPELKMEVSSSLSRFSFKAWKEFELPTATFATLASAGDMLTMCDERGLMSDVLQTLSGVSATLRRVLIEDGGKLWTTGRISDGGASAL